jgi:oxygen-independent coproporphyrinogen-3 oxidase
MSSISQIADAYWQNEKELSKYQESVNAGRQPRTRAYLMSPEDRIRRETIMRVMCDLSLDFSSISEQLGIDFEQHFAEELASLEPFFLDGLLERTSGGFLVSDAGRLFIRNIAMCFDNTLVPSAEQRHSKTI